MVGRSLLLAWEVPADREEPRRRFLQELSGSRYEEYAQPKRRLGVSAESVWLAPKPSGGGVAVVCLEAEHTERALCELAESETPFDSWYGREIRNLFGFHLARLPQVASGELLFTWRDGDPSKREAPRNA